MTSRRYKKSDSQPDGSMEIPTWITKSENGEEHNRKNPNLNLEDWLQKCTIEEAIEVLNEKMEAWGKGVSRCVGIRKESKVMVRYLNVTWHQWDDATKKFLIEHLTTQTKEVYECLQTIGWASRAVRRLMEEPTNANSEVYFETEGRVDVDVVDESLEIIGICVAGILGEWDPEWDSGEEEEGEELKMPARQTSLSDGSLATKNEKRPRLILTFRQPPRNYTPLNPNSS